MSKDLLEKEKEFRRMNKELQERTRDLMKEVEIVMAPRSDDWSFYNLNKSKTGSEIVCKNESEQFLKLTNPHCDIPQDSLSNKGEVKECNDENSKGKQSSASKAIVTVLNAKIDMLRNELQTTRIEYRKKCDYCKQLEFEYKKFDDQKLKLQNTIESLKDGTAKQEAANAELQTQSQMLQGENTSLKKDVEGLERRVKALQQESNNYEMRQNRIIEDNEKNKNSLKNARIEEKELRAEIRRLHEENRLSTKNLEKQRAELVNVFKKQTLLIDNLKKQIAYLVTAGHVKLSEKEFSRLLDQKLNDLS